MRLVIGIILVVLLAAALVGYLILVLNTEQMIYCGYIPPTLAPMRCWVR